MTPSNASEGPPKEVSVPVYNPELAAEIVRADTIGIIGTDGECTIGDCCGRALRMFRVAADEILGRNLAGLFPDAPALPLLHVLADAGRLEDPLQCMAVRPDGTRFPAMVSAFRTPAMDRRLNYFIVADLTCLHLQLAHLQKMTAAVEQTGDAVAMTDENGIVEYVNAAFEKLTGYTSAEIKGRTMAFLRSDLHPDDFYVELWRTLRAGEVFRARFANRRKDGRLLYEQKTISPIRDNSGHIVSFVSTAKDVTEQVETERRLDWLANYDNLTGLPNRNLFMDRLRQAVAVAARNRQLLALLYVDLDRFKLVNDSMGHAAGDELLRIAASRLSACVREVDTVCRLGGDEFAIILTGLDSVDDTRRVVDAILASFESPVSLEGRQVYISLSIGISLYPDNGWDAGTLLKQADMAMYQAKASGRHRYKYFHSGMYEFVRDSLTLETDLRGALERGEFGIDYQPQIDIRSGSIVAVEALLRWTHPRRGPVSPVQFIPLLEEMGLIGPVSNWVISTACEDIRKLADQTGRLLRVAVNLSSGQFKDPGLIRQVRTSLDGCGLDSRHLEVEITEGTLMESVAATVSTLESLSDAGVQIAVDDFGTGYSSLSYLRRFSVDTIKIDRSFIADTPGNEDARAIVKAIISLGRDLEMNVVAEGVETVEQFRFLQSLGCELVQGYLFSKPVPLAGLRHLMGAWKGIKAA